jgi:hypothetical protein
MDHRARSLAGIVLAALAGGQARAQSVAFGPPVAVPAATPPVQVALAPWTSPPAPDLLVGEPRVGGSSAFLYRRGDLASVPFPWAGPLTAGACFTAGSWVGPGLPAAPGDGLADLGWCGPSELRYQFSPDLPFGAASLEPADPRPTGLVFARLLDRTDLVLAVGERQQIEIAPGPFDAEFRGHQLYYPASRIPVAEAADTFALQPLQLGDVARSSGLHDLAWSRVGRPDLFVLWTLQASAQTALANWDGRLLAFAGALEVRGAGAADADGDRIPDLLAVVVPLAGSGRLVAVHNPGSPFSLDPASAVDVGAALGLAAPAFAAPLDLDGVPAAAVFDEGTTPPRLHVVTADPGGALRSWSTATVPAWGQATQVLAGDLVGSPAADLVAVFADGTIEVWPGDLAPAIAWAPGSPPAGAGTTAPLVLAVDAADPDGQLGSVELRLQGQPSGILPAQSGTRYTFTVPPATLCALGPSASVAVRATDDLGAWRELAAAVAISGAPDLRIEGAGSTWSVPLLPGGTTVALTAQVADGCGRPLNVAWAEQGLPAGASTSTVFAAGASVRTLVIPEAAYPAMVAGPSMSVPVAVTASAGGDVASAQIALAFDASGLVAAQHRSDRTALGPGELALLTTTLRSRIGVPLPAVTLDDRLSGLVPAGPARVSGARLVASVDGAEGLSVILDEIPGGGAPVVVELPVRRVEGPGGSSRAQAVAAATGVPLSPAAEAAAPGATAAGIACGSGGGSPLWLLGLFLYMKAMRRVPARTRSTSSSTPMSRQA